MGNERTREILTFIEHFQRERGFPPTIREIGKEFDIASTNGVRYHLHLLEKMGMIKRGQKISRGIESTRSTFSSSGTGIRILGRVAAGQPSTAEEMYEGTLVTDQLFGLPDELFALRVKGDSMIDAGVFENDYVVVRSQSNADIGQMVVALIDNEATVKYYRPVAGRVELVPANEKYHPIVIDGRDQSFRLLGVVRGVVRMLKG